MNRWWRSAARASVPFGMRRGRSSGTTAEKAATVGDLHARVEEHAEDSPWPLLRRQVPSMLVALLVAALALGSIEIAVFRSGLFYRQAHVTDPDSPAAKLLLVGRHAEARVVYVGDSTVLTDISPRIISDVCMCGEGFNAAFSKASPWQVAAMADEVVNRTRAEVVVVGVSPWALDERLRFEDSEQARELMSITGLAERGAQVDLRARVEMFLASVWSVYRERALIKESFASMLPRQAYDEARRGSYIPAGTALSPRQLAAGVARIVESFPTRPSATAAGARELTRLIGDLRGRGIEVVVLIPPLHPAALDGAGEYLVQAEGVTIELTRASGASLIDCRAAVSRDDFRDIDHLSEAGAAKFSRCIGATLRTR